MRSESSGPFFLVRVACQPQRPQALSILSIGMSVLLTIVAVTLGLTQDLPKLVLLVPLLVLVVAATHREAFFGDETAISGSIVVVCASFVAFRGHSPVLGPTICGIAAGVHFAHLRHRVWSKVLVNSAATGLAAAVGSASFALLSDGRPSVVMIAVAIPVAVTTYWLVDNLLIAAVLTCVNGDKLGERVIELTRAESVMVLFGIAGGIGALAFREAGIALGLVTIAALLVVVDVKVLATMALPALKRRTNRRHAPTVGYAGQLVLVAAMGVLGAIHGELFGAGAAVVGALAVTFLVALLGVHSRIGLWDRHLALGIAIVDAPLVIVFAVAGALAATGSVWLAIAVVSTALASSFALARRRQRKVACHVQDDERLAAAVELAVMDGRDWSASSR